jgi:hypothetical protein
VDDLLITGSKASESEVMKGKLKSEFETTDLGELSSFLGMEFLKAESGIVLHQKKYIGELLEKVEMNDYKLVNNPSETSSTMFRQMVGSLRYLCNCRPDICYSVSVISKFMQILGNLIL